MDNSITDTNFKDIDLEALAEYQDALIEQLHCNSGELQLIPDSRLEAFRLYVAGFSPEMTELARDLLINWGINKK
jgi:hypothetical protein